MRNVFFILIILFSDTTFSQELDKRILESMTIDSDSMLVKAPLNSKVQDYSSLWINRTKNLVHGYIGDNYQRFDIVILSARRIKNSNEYIIEGKSRVKNNICKFTGHLKVAENYVYKRLHFGVDDSFKDDGIKEQGYIIGSYKFYEDSSQKHSGIFEGTFASKWYLDKNSAIQYDDIQGVSDGYWNNAFVGTWKSYKNNNTRICNWGDYRIMFCGDLDIGAGEFSPNNKYLLFGWQTYWDAFVNNDSTARKIEETPWW